MAIGGGAGPGLIGGLGAVEVKPPKRLGGTLTRLNDPDMSLRMTMEVQMRVDKLDVCPIELQVMVDPVRLLHEDEEEPADGEDFVPSQKGPPHVISREAAERWLSKDPQQRCPLCRRRVVKLVNDVKAEGNLEEVIKGLVSEKFQGGDNLAHKAVKLMDPKLLCAIARVLALEDTFSMLLQENEEGYLPLSLLETVQSEEKQRSFLLGLPQRKPKHGAPEMTFSPKSAIYGGSEVWCHEQPVYAGSQFEGQDGALYTAIYAAGLEAGPSRLGRYGVLGSYSAMAPLSRQSENGPPKSEKEPADQTGVEGCAADETGVEGSGILNATQAGQPGAEEREEDEPGSGSLNATQAGQPGAEEREEDEPEDSWPALPPFVPGARPPTAKRGSPGVERWGTAVVLRNFIEEDRARFEICGIPVRHARMPRLEEGFDDEIYEPVVRIRVYRRSAKVFTGRLAARRGVWIGGMQHFDDCIIHGHGPRDHPTGGIAGAAALLLFDPATAQWRMLPGPGAEASRLLVLPSPGPEDETQMATDAIVFNSGNDPPLPLLPEAKRSPPGAAGGQAVPPEGLLLQRLAATRCRLGRVNFCVEPSFTARRYSERSGLPKEAVSSAEARRMRERLVLLVLETEIQGPVHGPLNTVSTETISRTTELGAVLSDFIIGRGESCHLRFSEVLSVSRSHCILELQEEGENGRLVAYDDGSLVGTHLHGKGPLGIGRASAQPVAEGDILALGQEVFIRLKAISPVLSLNDHQGLAAFFEQVGGRRTAQSLRQEPRLTERIISCSLTTGNIEAADWPERTNSFDLDSVLDDLENGDGRRWLMQL